MRAALFRFRRRTMITSPHNEKLKLIRKLQSRQRPRAHGPVRGRGRGPGGGRRRPPGPSRSWSWSPGEDVEPALLDAVSTLGSGTRVIGVYRQRWVAARRRGCSVYLHGVGDPGNVGTIIRAPTRSATGRWSSGRAAPTPTRPKAVRASMGSVFARPPARARLGELEGFKLGAGRASAMRRLRGARARAAGRPLPRRGARGPAATAVAGTRRDRPDPDAPRRPGLAERGDCGRRGACTSSRIGWPAVPDVQARNRRELRREAEAAIGAASDAAGARGAPGALPGPQGGADRDPARDRRAPGRGARAGRVRRPTQARQALEALLERAARGARGRRARARAGRRRGRRHPARDRPRSRSGRATC